MSWGSGRNGPGGLANFAGFGEKVGPFAGVEALLALVTRVEQRFAATVEGALQVRDEGHGLRGEDPGVAFAYRGENLNARHTDRWGQHPG